VKNLDPGFHDLPPLETTWRERSRSNTDVVMEELDAFGRLTGNVRVNTFALPPSPTRPPGDEISPLPADPPIHVHRVLIPWWKIIFLCAGMIAAADALERLL
jgi:hypothetical protein